MLISWEAAFITCMSSTIIMLSCQDYAHLLEFDDLMAMNLGMIKHLAPADGSSLAGVTRTLPVWISELVKEWWLGALACIA